MLEYLSHFHPIILALFGTLFTWIITALGAATVFVFKTIDRKVMDGMLGFAAGVMIAASFWSLLAPAIELAEEQGVIPWIPATSGFLLGAGFFWFFDKIIPHLHIGFPKSEAEGVKTSWHRSILLVTSITMHNAPEGLAVGVAFGALGYDFSMSALAGAVALAIGIGIQDFPEGAAVSLPLRREGLSRWKSFWYGQMSGLVEPVFGVIGAAAVIFVAPLLPYALSFAAGAMIFVVVEELIPESQIHKEYDTATVGAVLGFALMMTLDVALG